MESPGPPPPGRAAAAAAAERRRKLREFLAAKRRRRRRQRSAGKGGVAPAGPKPYLKDRTHQQNCAASEPELTARCKRNDSPSTVKGTQKAEPKQAFLAGSHRLNNPFWGLTSQDNRSHLSGKKYTAQVPPNVTSGNAFRNLSLSAKHSLGQAGKNEVWRREGVIPGAGSSFPSWRNPLNNTQEKKQHHKNREVKDAPHLQKGTALDLKDTSRVNSDQLVKKTKEAAERCLPRKTPLYAGGTAEVLQAQEDDLPLALFRHAAHSQRQVSVCAAARPSSKVGQSSVLKSTVRKEGQKSGVSEQPVQNPQAAGALGQKGGNAVPLTHRNSHVRTNACPVLQEKKHPNHSQISRKSKLSSSAVHDADGHSRSIANRNQNKKLLQVPRNLETKFRHKAPTGCTISSLKQGRGEHRSKHPKMRSSQEPQTSCTQDRRHLLQEWLASKKKQYKRPAMSLLPRRPLEGKEGEEKEKREQRVFTNKIADTLAECLKLAEKGFPSEELLGMLSHIPEGEKFALFWICKARLLADRGTLDALELYREAVCAGATPLQDLRDVIVEILKSSSQPARDMPAEAHPFQKDNHQSTFLGAIYKPVSAIKLQVTPLHRRKEESQGAAGMKLLTPVRRSLRIESASACYPQMLKDHNPVVSSLEEIMDSESQFVFRRNEALAEFEAVLPPLLPNVFPATSRRLLP